LALEELGKYSLRLKTHWNLEKNFKSYLKYVNTEIN